MGKMEMIDVSEVQNKQEIIPIMELFSKKYDNINKKNILKYRRLELIRVLIYIVAKENYLWLQLDIGNAFLNGKLDTTYFYSLPQKLKAENPNKIRKTCQAMYGLKEAPLYWHKEISEKLEKEEKKTILKHKEKCIIGFIYVDDILFAGRNEQDLNWIIKTLGEHYKVKNTFNANNFLGFEINKDSDYIYLTAKNYIVNLCEAFEKKD
eukprot:maker-scaffold_5-snap-gene-15.3-mRNA-1 protein AED:0.28 eAED:0.28 QI:0/0/0/0.66/0/0/3/0/207